MLINSKFEYQIKFQFEFCIVHFKSGLLMVCLAGFDCKNASLITTTDGVHGIRPLVTRDVMSNSPFVSQANTRQFGRRI